MIRLCSDRLAFYSPQMDSTSVGLIMDNFSQRFIARLATRTRKRRERRERARDLLLKATRRPSSAHKVTNSDTPAADHRKGTGPMARNPASHKTKVQYSPEL